MLSSAGFQRRQNLHPLIPGDRPAADRADRVERRKILYFVPEDWYFCSHRLMLARAAREKGFEVAVATRVNAHGNIIRAEGFTLIPLRLRREGKNLWHELLTIWELIRIYRRERPDILHQVALKPILYGTIAALFTRKTTIVNVLAGLGFLSTSSSLKARVLNRLIRPAFKLIFGLRRTRLIVQNQDDYKEQLGGLIKDEKRILLIIGDGVDTSLFTPGPEPAGITTVILPARMLSNKGVTEFYEAARSLKSRGVEARFVLVGRTDPASPAAISAKQLETWVATGIIEWRGHCDDMPEVYRNANIVCLPSYREGIPKALLEAAASGRAIVATDVPGCREVVRPRVNGLLVPPRDSLALAEALQTLILNPDLRRNMGIEGREIAIKKFSAPRIIGELLKLYDSLIEMTVITISVPRVRTYAS